VSTLCPKVRGKCPPMEVITKTPTVPTICKRVPTQCPKTATHCGGGPC
jgi:hypothetical protein